MRLLAWPFPFAAPDWSEFYPCSIIQDYPLDPYPFPEETQAKTHNINSISSGAFYPRFEKVYAEILWSSKSFSPGQLNPIRFPGQDA